MGKSIAIIGAGISGMSSAYLLVNKGYSITIYARAFSPNITSNKAAAFWFPYQIRNDKRGIKWSAVSYEYYRSFAEDPSTGISMKQLKKVLSKDVKEEGPSWLQFIPEGACRLLDKKEMEPGQVKVYNITVPLIETQIFLPWLQNQLLQKGVSFVEKEIVSFDELTSSFDYIINCAALGAKELCNDAKIMPIRGQVALLSPSFARKEIYIDNEKLLYIVPRKDAIIIGGTYEEGITEAVTEPLTIERILNTAYEAFPALKQQEVIGSWAGLRPYRPEVRVQKEAGLNIIHNYGHGGSGFTLSFGCAEEVCTLVK
jgi:D-amino-acid oxidase